MQVDIETWVWFLGWKDPLEEEMASGSSVLAWRIQRTEEPGGLQSTGCKELDMTEQLTLSYTHKTITIIYAIHVVSKSLRLFLFIIIII